MFHGDPNDNPNDYTNDNPNRNRNDGTSTKTSSVNPNSFHENKDVIIKILGEVLETCMHEILYNRHIYPRDAFVPTRYLGIRCHGCRIPMVVDYIVEALLVAVPCIVTGSVDCLSLLIIDRDTKTSNSLHSNYETVLEKYNFEFDSNSILSSFHAINEDAMHNQSNSSSITKLIQELEWGFKQLLLRIITLEVVPYASVLPSSISFKICMRTSNDTYGDTQMLEKALSEGKWFQPNEESCMITTKSNNDTTTFLTLDSNEDKQQMPVLLRPLKDIHIPNIGLKMNLTMEVPGSNE